MSKGVLLCHFSGCIVSPNTCWDFVHSQTELICWSQSLVDIPEYINMFLMRSDYYDPV